MECKHEVISMKHSIAGYLNIFDNSLVLTGGRGYIEKDWGHSFPTKYTWIQCNRFIREDASLMLSIARIPYMGTEFVGCICAIHYKGREYRFATYLGVKIKESTKNVIYLKQGIYKLIIFLDQNNSEEDQEVLQSKSRKFSYQLNAPSLGEMSRPIKEEHLLEGRFILFREHSKVFDLRSKDISVEYVE